MSLVKLALPVASSTTCFASSASGREIFIYWFTPVALRFDGVEYYEITYLYLVSVLGGEQKRFS